MEHTEDPLLVTREDRGREEELEDYFDSWDRSCDGEDRSGPGAEKHMLWKVQRIMGVCGEKDRQKLSQNSNTNNLNLEQDLRGPLELKANGLEKDKDPMGKK